MEQDFLYYPAINWNEVEDPVDKSTWEKLTEQFWLDTRIPLSMDIADWKSLSEKEQRMLNLVFGTLTLLDTVQSNVGASVLATHAKTDHEAAVYHNIMFMETVHAKSYSSIFSTFLLRSEIKELFIEINNDSIIQKKVQVINNIYWSKSPNEFEKLKIKVASVLLESFQFYSGFYAPLYYLGNNLLPNVAEIIKLIIRDESVHGSYIGYKFQLGYNELSEEEQKELKNWTYSFLYELYEIEESYTKYVYDPLGWTENVLVYARYNANKALMNLGFDALFPDTHIHVNPIVMNGISTTTTNHDFFSQVGNGYLMGVVEPMSDTDYDVGNLI